MGGFAVFQAYGLERATIDFDVIAVLPYGTAIRLDVITVASVPEIGPRD